MTTPSIDHVVWRKLPSGWAQDRVRQIRIDHGNKDDKNDRDAWSETGVVVWASDRKRWDKTDVWEPAEGILAGRSPPP